MMLDARGKPAELAPPGKALMKKAERGKAVFRTNVPQPEYDPPSEYRSILGRDRIGLDIETKDPGISEKGSGAHRPKDGGFVTGTAIAYGLDDAEYYPVAHKTGNMPDPDRFFERLREDAQKFEGEIVGTNLQYDLDWLRSRHGIIFPKAKFRDVQVAEPLLDENRLTYKLNVLLDDYFGKGKLTSSLENDYGSGYIENMDQVHAGHAAIYARGDTTLPWELFDAQTPRLHEENLWELFDLESRLTPLLLEMRQVGVRVDLEAAEQAYRMTQEKRKECIANIKYLSGVSVEPWAADSIARAFSAVDIPFEKTANGKPSFRKDWLEAHESQLAQLIVDARAFDKIGGTFINSYILEGHVDGRVHAMFNQLRSDSSGTVSGRFSSSNPNLQNIPTRHPELGPLCRSMFIPEDGQLWGSLDWSQIEYRFLVHYAHIAPGIDAARAVDAYRNDPDTDFHAMAAALTGLPRSQSKNINFGVVYGMGVPKLARSLGLSIEDARKVMEQFQAEAPFMRDMLDMASRRAAQVGYIKTILGRRRRFTDWECDSQLFRSYEAAEEHYRFHKRRGSPPRRAFTHKALNALLQGSAADLMKKAMVQMWEDGIFNVLTPHLTVHDEFNSSVPDTKEGQEAFEEMRRIMETTMELAVPVRADGALGENWAKAK